VAPYANNGEVKLRISARAESSVAAKNLIEPIEQQLLQIAGLDCYGADTDTLASTVGKLLLLAGETLSVAESCTGGGLGAMLTVLPGVRGTFWAGLFLTTIGLRKDY
jgi:Uncharacterized protein (competence- and mitomycin-induced)